MSVREEDRQKNNCPSRGFGLAAAAIGVGVGAALYYFFSKRPENPDTEGSTQEWQCEAPQNLSYELFDHSDEDSNTTISEHTTTDTSIIDDTQSSFHSMTDNDSDVSIDSVSSSVSSNQSYASQGTIISIDSISDTSAFHSSMNISSLTESDVNEEWDVTSSSVDVPSDRRELIQTPIDRFLNSLASPRRRCESHDQQQLNQLRSQAFRERSWTLEECSICFELILKDQEVMALSCAHNFHTGCILPWLQEQQTCPNCRKAVD